MKILVLSDSHSSLRFMRSCMDAVKPNAVIHLGDYFDDGQAISEEYPDVAFYQVPGNCDRYRCPPFQPEILITKVCGVELYMTHGHRHQVKMTTTYLLRDARAVKAAAALYGHTHIPDCRQEPDGLWVLNPGSCGYSGGTAGIMEVAEGKIISCRIIGQLDLEETV